MPRHTHCRTCDKELPEPFLDLGAMPLANAFLSNLLEAGSEPRYPLAVAGCRTCGLVQLTYVVPAEQLYRDYIYVSSTSEAVRAHADRLATGLIARYGWTPSDLVVEVASNDGTVLEAFKRRGVRVVGVEPARNIAAIASDAGIPTIPEFFDRRSARTVLSDHGRAAGILGRHVFAHVDDVHEFLEAVRACLADDGVFLIEVPYLGDLIDNLEFDTIYHEHLSYFALAPLDYLCRQHGLKIVDVERIALHGGSIIVHMQLAHRGTGASDRAARLLEAERASAMSGPERLAAFARAVGEWKERLEELVAALQRAGARLVGYGAAAKANTLLNFCPAAAAALAYILDRSPHKHGRYTPGTHIRVEPVDRWMNDSRPTHMLLLAWNFKDEIIAQMKSFSDGGGRFIVPIPRPHVL